MPIWVYGLATALIFRTIVYLNRKGYFEKGGRPKRRRATDEPVDPNLPVAFGNKINWLAIPTTNTQLVARSLRLADQQRCNWATGIQQAYDNDKTFVTPPVNGWVFVVGGLPYPDSEEQLGALKEVLELMSRDFERVLFFGSMISVGFESWIWAEKGTVIRAFVEIEGEVLTDEGKPLPGEERLGGWPSAENTAGNWSINPASIQGRTEAGNQLGILGEYAF